MNELDKVKAENLETPKFSFSKTMYVAYLSDCHGENPLITVWTT